VLENLDRTQLHFLIFGPFIFRRPRTRIGAVFWGLDWPPNNIFFRFYSSFCFFEKTLEDRRFHFLSSVSSALFLLSPHDFLQNVWEFHQIRLPERVFKPHLVCIWAFRLFTAVMDFILRADFNHDLGSSLKSFHRAVLFSALGYYLSSG
jgi:hypothetical protein